MKMAASTSTELSLFELVTGQATALIHIILAVEDTKGSPFLNVLFPYALLYIWKFLSSRPSESVFGFWAYSDRALKVGSYLITPTVKTQPSLTKSYICMEPKKTSLSRRHKKYYSNTNLLLIDPKWWFTYYYVIKSP